MPTSSTSIPTSSACSAAPSSCKSLPNRAELRLKSTDTVIGYTLSLVRDDDGDTVGAALFFKDLTHVEQIEERERLRDRLAAVGEMAAVMAHEIKNPLAGIEVLAGLLRRKVPDNPEAQAPRQGHHQRSEDGERDRPGSARVRAAGPPAGRSHVARRGAVERGRRWPTARRRAATSSSTSTLPRRPAAARRGPAPADAGVLQPADQRLRSARRAAAASRSRRGSRTPPPTARCSPTAIRPCRPWSST